MNYELAKQLKDAGFPIVEKADRLSERTYLTKDLDYAYAPTLSELIEACGEEFVLEKINSGGLHQWTAGIFIDRDGEIEKAQTADTPEEAVAKLWFSLNAKDDTQGS